MTRYIGSDFDDFLREEGIYEEVNSVAMKRVLARQLREIMHEQRVTKAELARRMHTSRAQLDRLLDEEKTGVKLETVTKAALALGKRVRLELTPL